MNQGLRSPATGNELIKLMAKKSVVSVLKTSPETYMNDYKKLMHLAGYKKEIKKKYETILKLNLSWSLFYPACSTPPWQLDAVLKTLTDDGYENLIPVENKTVVTNPWKGAKQNKWLPVLGKYGLRFTPLTDVEWVTYKPKGEMIALDELFQGTHKIPKIFMNKNVIHLPTMKCVHGDTEIVLSDGSVKKIKDIVEKVHSNEQVVVTPDGDNVAESNHNIISYNNGNMIESKAYQFWKTPSPKYLYEIKTKTGKGVKTSGKHPFLTPNGWRRADQIRKGERIGVPRIIKIKGEKQTLPKIKTVFSDLSKVKISKINFRKGKKYSIKDQKKIVELYLSGETTIKIAKKFNTHYESIRIVLKRYNIPIIHNKRKLIIPEKTSEDFWSWLGYFIAEGYSGDSKGSVRFWWTNTNPILSREFEDLSKKLFNIKLSRRGNDFYFDSNEFSGFMNSLGFSKFTKAGNKKIPDILFKCTEKEAAAFIRAYFDGDGSVCKDGCHMTTKSMELAVGIQKLLLRLGVVSFIKKVFNRATNVPGSKKMAYWNVSIYGDELINFYNYVKPKLKKKLDKLECFVKRRLNSKRPSNWDTIPINPKIFRKVREGLGFTQSSSGKPTSVNNIENMHSLPTRHIIKYFVALFEKSDVHNKYIHEINYMKSLSSQSIAWDYIDSVKKIKSDSEYVYDLSVKDSNSFVGNSVILHNTHGHTTITGAMKNAFGGLITQRRHHSHKVIHEVLVDLLTIQKEIHKGIFAVTDGTICGDGAGPRTMDWHEKNYLLASNDQVAIDAVSAKMMGFEPLSIPFIRIAHDKGLGCGDIKQLDIKGEDVSRVNYGFRTGKSLVVYWDQVLRKKLPLFEPLLFHTPLFNACILGSAVYHDYLWYPLIGKPRVNKFMKSDWGKVFKRY